jgi:Superfamily II DNA helicase
MSTNSIPFDQHTTKFTSTCLQTFHRNPYHWQIQVGSSILRFQANGIGVKQLCIRPTGGGKTLLFTGVACCLKGVTLCVTPLLSLGTDQAHNLLNNTKNDSSITAFHLDEVPPSSISRLLDGIIKNANRLAPAQKTIILYSSPQCLERYKSAFLNHIIPFIQFIVIDEIHLVSQFGSSFRKEFLALKDILFAKVSTITPVLLLTATCNNWIYESLQQILGITINQIHWPSALEMKHRSVAMSVTYGTKSTSFITKKLKKDLMAGDHYKVLVYSNSRVQILDIAEKLKSNFIDSDESLSDFRLVTLVGTMTKEEKASYIRLFVCNETHPISPRIRILCATSGVGNAGIDCKYIKAVYRVGFPPSILDLAQEKGRAGRCNDASPDTYSYNVCVSLESFVYLFKRIQNSSDSICNASYHAQQERDLFHVANLLLSSRICLAVACEQAMGNPLMPSVLSTDPCGYCPCCLQQRLVPSISRGGVKRIIFDLFIESPYVINKRRNIDTN